MLQPGCIQKWGWRFPDEPFSVTGQGKNNKLVIVRLYAFHGHCRTYFRFFFCSCLLLAVNGRATIAIFHCFSLSTTHFESCVHLSFAGQQEQRAHWQITAINNFWSFPWIRFSVLWEQQITEHWLISKEKLVCQCNSQKFSHFKQKVNGSPTSH